MGLIVSVDIPRYHALLIGTASYRSEEWNRIAEGVEAEIKLAHSLFTRKLEYDDCQAITPITDRALGVKVTEWARSLPLSPGDCVLVYYTGHGIVDQNGQLRLLTSDIGPDQEITAVLATEFVTWLSNVKADVLLVLDTCYSGAATADALALQERARTTSGAHDRIRFITAASPVQVARPGWFMQALSAAVEEVPGRYDEWMPLEKVVHRVNVHLAKRSLELRLNTIRSDPSVDPAHLDRLLEQVSETHARDPESSQRARFMGAIEDLSHFFPNRGRLELTGGMERQQALRVLHSIQTSAFRNHWDPRARGVTNGTENGWFFSGRCNALAHLNAKVAASVEGRPVVVAGMAGSGKSALLVRFVTLADPEHRRRAEDAGALKDASPQTIPEPGCVDVAVHARAKSVASVAMEIAVACGASLDGDWNDPEASLVTALQHGKKRRRVIVVDAIDEAEDPPRLAFLLRSLAEPPCSTCVVAGIRTDAAGASTVLSRLGGDVELLNLDDGQFWDQADIAAFAERYLRTQAGSPYRSLPDPGYLAEVAQAIAARAKCSFLVAATTTRSLASRSEPVPPDELASLPVDAGKAFEMDLKRFGSAWRQGLTVLGALAFARGRGLPHDIWPLVATAIAPSTTEDDVKYWKEKAGFYVVREKSDGEEVCRLYHDEFARHLRKELNGKQGVCSNRVCPHGSRAACVAMRLLAEANEQADSGKRVSPHVLEHLAGYLAVANLRKPLVRLVTSSWWREGKRHASADPVGLLSDLSTAIGLLRREPHDLRTYIRLCVLASMEVTPKSFGGIVDVNGASLEAPWIVIDTLARAGQLGRARLLADNVLFALDRCQAHTLLAQRCHEQGAFDDALACLTEARRTVAAIGTDFMAMGCYWVCRAAIAIGRRREAQQFAELARASIPTPKREHATWNNGALHATLWAGLCFRALKDDHSLARLRWQLKKAYRPRSWMRYGNLNIQAAAVVDDRAFLREALAARLAGSDHLKPGNLELALASAGMNEEWNELEHGLGAQGQWPGASRVLLWRDSGKRFVWALALKGRYDEALRVLHEIELIEERARALYRVSECAAQALTPELKQRLCEAADRVLAAALAEARSQTPERSSGSASSSENTPAVTTATTAEEWAHLSDQPRAIVVYPLHKLAGKGATAAERRVAPWKTQSWLASVYLVAGMTEKAIGLCDEVCNSGVVVSGETSLCLPVLETWRSKGHVFLHLDPTEDEEIVRELQAALDEDSLGHAEALLAKIHSRRLRARGMLAIALRHRDPGRALDRVLDALGEASRGGIHELIYVLDHGREVLARANPGSDLEVFLGDIEKLVRAGNAMPPDGLV